MREGKGRWRHGYVCFVRQDVSCHLTLWGRGEEELSFFRLPHHDRHVAVPVIVMSSISPSRLDAIYRTIIKSKFFAKGGTGRSMTVSVT